MEPDAAWRRRARPGWIAVLLFSALVQGQDTVTRILTRADADYARFDNLAALGAYQEAYALEPRNFAVLVGLARASHDLGLDLLARDRRRDAEERLRESLAWARKLREAFPREATSYSLVAAASGNLARFLGGKKKVEVGKEVQENALKAIDLDPRAPLPHAILGVFYREVAGLNWVERAFARLLYGGVPKASLDDASAELERALELDPQLTFAHYELALTYKAMRRRQDALRHLKRTVELSPATSQDRRNQEEAERLYRRWAPRE